MPSAAASQTIFTRARPWVAVVLLTVTSILGGGLVAPVCYWLGRASLGPNPRFIPLAWAPEAAPSRWAALGLAVAWVVLWSLYALSVRSRPIHLAFAAIPFLAFVLVAYLASSMSYACNPM
ncbi:MULTISPECIES: hypothetical protein [unclassified Caulobacter]|uniref:hypothetical protein n=1 Tax=unclassified Caulobacter TaxID=2648921 RepID=UPI0004A747C2|nr:hypothetical protein [Caulobacter sp. UNC358MFTsu5.1]